jgi:hypothetical protein
MGVQQAPPVQVWPAVQQLPAQAVVLSGQQ